MLRILLVIASATSTTDASQSPDVALLLLEEEVSRPLPTLMPREFGGNLRVGQPLGTPGFPADLAGETGVLVLPTFKEGTLSALLRSTPMILTEPIPWT